ncbi:hypothetical protein SAMN04487917_101342 [Arthrobacter sp. yr096]|uniref:hypothetical protein n=1 Tax=Arthrobacter sp. yr096 TaxID=1761750 RepID=UPI0008C72E7C|nr:hypothetical protein [Arthrobacter sp. yr096]SEI44747.1 hypothetical protein SAMN04487917_101342 [Arthrobacter sp. yr096]
MSKYEPLDIGLKQIAQSSEVQAATLAVAQRMAGNANAVGDSKYEAASQTVTAGWDNERRSGAVVRETEPHWKDWRDGVLLRVANAMKERRQ